MDRSVENRAADAADTADQQVREAREDKRGRQAQKTENARRTIHEATIHCLAHHGYAETSINRVVEKAGVSRGALQHHFPSKEDLMASTAAYLLERPLRIADPSTNGRDIRSRLLDLWDRLMNTSAYLALLEILIAARTDSVLHARIAAGLKASVREIDEHFLASDLTTDLPFEGDLSEQEEAELRLLMTANRCLMRGLVIEEQYGLSPAGQRQVLERWLDLVVPVLERKDRKTT
jgi:AcrR family transcriptional regulator